MRHHVIWTSEIESSAKGFGEASPDAVYDYDVTHVRISELVSLSEGPLCTQFKVNDSPPYFVNIS